MLSKSLYGPSRFFNKTPKISEKVSEDKNIMKILGVLSNEIQKYLLPVDLKKKEYSNMSQPFQLNESRKRTQDN